MRQKVPGTSPLQRYPSKYRVIFSIRDQTVRVLNIRHGARRLLHEDR